MREGRMKRAVRVTVNGAPHARDVDVRSTLADFLREDLDLTGTHVGCEHGVCGACTVLIDGIAPGEGLHPVQEAFWAKHGLQCGYCTPGIIVSACAFLAEHPAPTHEEIREMLAGHLCRCTGYHFIVEAIAEAARTMAGGRKA